MGKTDRTVTNKIVMNITTSFDGHNHYILYTHTYTVAVEHWGSVDNVKQFCKTGLIMLPPALCEF